MSVQWPHRERGGKRTHGDASAVQCKRVLSQGGAPMICLPSVSSSTSLFAVALINTLSITERFVAPEIAQEKNIK